MKCPLCSGKIPKKSHNLCKEHTIEVLKTIAESMSLGGNK